MSDQADDAADQLSTEIEINKDPPRLAWALTQPRERRRQVYSFAILMVEVFSRGEPYPGLDPFTVLQQARLAADEGAEVAKGRLGLSIECVLELSCSPGTWTGLTLYVSTLSSRLGQRTRMIHLFRDLVSSQ
jgi:hypothetical protein